MIVFLLLKIRVLITLNNSVNFILLIDSVPKSSIIKRSELNILSKKSLEILFFPNQLYCQALLVQFGIKRFFRYRLIL